MNHVPSRLVVCASVTLLGCASAAPPAAIAPSDAIRCALEGDVASAQLRVDARSASVLDAVIHDVPSRVLATDARLVIEVRSPLAFAGVSSQLDVVARADASVDGVAIARPLRLVARHGLPDEAVRLRVPGRYGLELALPCAALALGRPGHDAEVEADPDAHWYDVDAEVAVHREGSDAIVAWIGSDRANAAVFAALEASEDPARARVRVFGPGVVVTGRIDRAHLTERPEAAVRPPPSSGTPVPAPAPALGVVDVPRGARVYADPTDREPWATTSAPLVLVASSRQGERVGVVSIEDRPTCAADACAGTDLRWVIARRRTADGDDESAGSIGAWFDASEVHLR